MPNLPDRALALFAKATGSIAPWHRWPFLIAVPTLAGLRVTMRSGNLFDTETAPTPVAPAGPDPCSRRTADGTRNSLDVPWMGSAGARFGRNVPIDQTFGETDATLMVPSPRLVSERLLARTTFAPVPYLNVFVSSWLQFMVHDWLSHGPNDKRDPLKVPLPPGDDWPQDPMTVLRTARAPRTAADEGRPDAFRNTETHWWDGSQIYGSSQERQDDVRRDPATGAALPDGKLFLDARGHLPIQLDARQNQDVDGAVFKGLELSGVNGNWWLGLSVMTTLFVREHNVVVDRLKLEYPGADGDWLFGKARLVVTALIAKIHTTEWTPALMNSPEGRFVMRANWWGLVGEHFHEAYGRLDGTEEVSGIPGSPGGQDGAPYAITEEFTACYRMHPLMPDGVAFRRHDSDAPIVEKGLLDLVHAKVASVYDEVPFDDVVYSLATSNPGALALHNYPNALRRLPEKPEQGLFTDLAATDILRDRERGVPRYCRFRRLLGMTAPKSFDELTTDPQWRADVESVYADIEDVDLLVGTLCESRADPGTPKGFGFSDTVFRIFILMASRRLRSDRFYTTDFTADVYTPPGFAWVADNGFRDVLRRHCPALAPRFAQVRNVFFPWARGVA